MHPGSQCSSLGSSAVHDRGKQMTSTSQLQQPCLATIVSMGLCALLVSSIEASAQVQDSEGMPLDARVIEHTLDNGWRFLLLPHGAAPTISFETYVSTGSADDPEVLSGLSHHVKNLLFKGSARIGTRNWEAEEGALLAVDEAYSLLQEALEAGTDQEISSARLSLSGARQRANQWVISEEFSRVLEDAGGGPTLNAYTDEDSTRFVVSLPSNQLLTWCWMESERFRAPVFREFYVERDALLEDRRARVETDSLGLLAERLRAAAFADHPLGNSTVGTQESILRLDRPSAEEFFRTRFGARNLTSAIVGSFDPVRLIPVLDTYFGSVPAGPKTLPERAPLLDQQSEQRVQVSTDGPPVISIAWRIPPRAHPDSAAIEIAVRLLGYARSSRLEKRLIREKALVSELVLSPAWGSNRRDSLAMIRAVPNLGVDITVVEAAIYEEIHRLERDGPDEKELAGVKRVATADHIRSLRDNASIAAGLTAALVETGDWRNFLSTGRQLAAVSEKDVRRALRTWFIPERRTVAILVPVEEEE